MSDAVLIEVSGGAATLTINRPERRNALSGEVMDGLLDGLARARTDPDVRVVVITGAGDGAFCAGADLSGPRPATALAAFDARGRMAELFRQAYGLGKPTIAKVRGYALAGGFGLALTCDIVIAGEQAKFGTPEIDIGMWPMMITVPMLRSMNPKTVLELQMTGRRVTAQEGQRLGFVNRVVPEDELDKTVEELVAVLREKPPAVLRVGRDAFYRVLDQDSESALAFLQASLTLVQQTDDCREGVLAFKEKRAPRWSGR